MRDAQFAAPINSREGTDNKRLGRSRAPSAREGPQGPFLNYRAGVKVFETTIAGAGYFDKLEKLKEDC